jgi:NAD(P) transhydrogenase
MLDEYDLVAIGAGPAGESATALAAFHGHRAAVIERSRPGGTVTTTGGAPTKTLREAALYLTGFRNDALYGLRMAAPAEIATDIIRRRTADVCELLQRVTADNIAAEDIDYIEGAARLAPGGTVIVSSDGQADRSIRAKVILIATGSRPWRPANVSFEIPGVCDTDTILQRGRVPKAIVIVGGGAVGIEFATICHALGAQVTLVELGSRLMAAMDGEVAGYLQELFAKWGMSLLFDTSVESVAAQGQGVDVTLSSRQRLSVDTVLFAAGRVANTEGLGLEALGVDLAAQGAVAVDSDFRTSVPGIYAAGDLVRPTLASISMEQGRAAVCHAFGIPFEGTVDPCPVSAIYGMPEVSGAGLTEEQCREQGLDYETGRTDLALTPRGAIAGHGGLLKLIFLRGDSRLIGVHCVGDLASEIVGIGQMAIRCGGTLDTFASMALNTPTYSYAYKYAAFDGIRRLQRKARLGARPRVSAHQAQASRVSL